MIREMFIKRYNSAFIALVTEKDLEAYNLGYTCALLSMGLVTGIITLQECLFLSHVRDAVMERR